MPLIMASYLICISLQYLGSISACRIRTFESKYHAGWHYLSFHWGDSVIHIVICDGGFTSMRCEILRFENVDHGFADFIPMC